MSPSTNGISGTPRRSEAFETLTIRHRFLDYTGKYVMHCHILFHEDHGMMQLLEVIDPAAPTS